MAEDKTAEWGLYIESMWLRHHHRVARVANIGRIWGTRTEDLKNPIGVLGRVGRTIPEVIELARGLYSEANSLYAEKLLQQELPHVVFGTASDSVAEDRPGTPRPSGNIDTEYVVPLLRGVASILSLKIDDTPLFNGPNGKAAIYAIKVYLGEGIVIGTLLKGSRDAPDIYAPILSTHTTAEVLTRISALWKSKDIKGMEIRSLSGPNDLPPTLLNCSFSQMRHPHVLIVGNTFANDYVRIADRMARFERAGIKRNLMLLGPPGCGKTQVAKRIALTLDKFIVVVDSNVIGSSSTISTLTYFFPNIILICDDFDRFHGNTEALLTALESTGSSLIVTCNTVWGFDKATIRVGRIDEIIEVPKPDPDMRKRLYTHFYQELREEKLRLASTYEIPTEMVESERVWAAEHTDGFTPAEIRESVKCYLALGFTDFKLDIKRIRKQAKIMEELLYDVSWARSRKDESGKQSVTSPPSGLIEKTAEAVSPSDWAEEAAEVEDDDASEKPAD